MHCAGVGNTRVAIHYYHPGISQDITVIGIHPVADTKRAAAGSFPDAVVAVGQIIGLKQKGITAGIGINGAIVGETVNADCTGTGNSMAGILCEVAVAKVSNPGGFYVAGIAI